MDFANKTATLLRFKHRVILFDRNPITLAIIARPVICLVPQPALVSDFWSQAVRFVIALPLLFAVSHQTLPQTDGPGDRYPHRCPEKLRLHRRTSLTFTITVVLSLAVVLHYLLYQIICILSRGLCQLDALFLSFRSCALDSVSQYVFSSRGIQSNVTL